MQEALAHPLFVLLGIYLLNVSDGINSLAPKLVGERLHVFTVDHGHLNRDLRRVEVNQAARVCNSSVLRQLILHEHESWFCVWKLVLYLVK